MNPQTLIRTKRDGGELSSQQIADLVAGYVNGGVPDYQMAAFAMAVYFADMTTAETAALTQAMLHSGQVMSWPDDGRPVVDKHSTGGVGDKVSLLLAPLLACEGLRVPMISGRGLGPTGGTLDKLESIAGFRTDLSIEETQDVVDRVGCVITGASDQIAPADRQLYALRDVTATVESIPLITASIMSKKLSEGLDALVLDVKCGSGAFMKSRDDATVLARSLVNTGASMGVATSALLTDMNQPLGRMVGNAVEVDETIDGLSGRGPNDLMEVTLTLGAELLQSCKMVRSRDDGVARLNKHVSSGAALEKLREMVAAQGGDLDAARPVAPVSEITAKLTGHVASINTQQLGEAIIELGGGRKVKTDQIDHSVGLEMLVRLGDAVESGQPLVKLFANSAGRDAAEELIEAAIEISDEPATVPPLVGETISPDYKG